MNSGLKMSKAVFDTRFFMAGYYSQDANEVKKLKEKNRVTKERFLSPIVIHEIYQLTLKKERPRNRKIQNFHIRARLQSSEC